MYLMLASENFVFVFGVVVRTHNVSAAILRKSSSLGSVGKKCPFVPSGNYRLFSDKTHSLPALH